MTLRMPRSGWGIHAMGRKRKRKREREKEKEREKERERGSPRR